MAIIDPHHHLWDLKKIHYPWLEEEDKTTFFGSYEPLAKNYTVDDYLADTRNQELEQSVHLQAECDPDDPVAETRWLAGLADQCGFPSAIVAYADFSREDIQLVLEQHCAFDRVRGIRQILNYHHDPALTYTGHNLLQDENWCRNFSLLSRYNLSFELQLYYQQMKQAAALAAGNDNIQFILNHAGMPVERDEAGIAGWRAGMRTLAACDNVVVKISGLGMTDPQWTTESIRPFVLQTIDLFGVGRCMFASNFPVDSLFSDYDTLYAAYRTITTDFSTAEQALLFHNNAARYYRL
jgi:predicted TIM-barrel fold metal-dependent hydrolase